MLLNFVQLELPGQIGLPEGRYLAREGESERVLIVQVLGAPRPRGRRRSRPRPAVEGVPDEVPVSRLTVTGIEQFDGRAEALAWLEQSLAEASNRAELVRDATRVVNRALNALRAAARDPLVQEIGATRALSVRIGFGEGEQVADGRWSEARELPPPRRSRREDVGPQSRVAAVLGGRDQVHPAETLLQRARLDAELGRQSEATYGLRAARAALAEQPPVEAAKIGAQIEQLEERIAGKLGER